MEISFHKCFICPKKLLILTLLNLHTNGYQLMSINSSTSTPVSPANRISDCDSNTIKREPSIIVTDQPKTPFKATPKEPSTDIIKHHAKNQNRTCYTEKTTEKSSCIAIAAGTGAGVCAIGCGGGGVLLGYAIASPCTMISLGVTLGTLLFSSYQNIVQT